MIITTINFVINWYGDLNPVGLDLNFNVLSQAMQYTLLVAGVELAIRSNKKQ